MKTIKYYTFSWLRSNDKPDEVAENTIKVLGNVSINEKYIIKVKRIDNSPIFMVLVDEITHTQKYYTDYEGYQILKNNV